MQEKINFVKENILPLGILLAGVIILIIAILFIIVGAVNIEAKGDDGKYADWPVALQVVGGIGLLPGIAITIVGAVVTYNAVKDSKKETKQE